MGTRGIPARYGGFETCAEELAVRMSKHHKIAVYCRSYLYPKKIRFLNQNLELIYLPCLRSKSLETLTHTWLSCFHSLFINYDAVVVFNAANMPALLFSGILMTHKIILNTDGLEWKRKKWGKIGKRYYLLCEWLASNTIRTLIADSIGIQRYYATRYHKETTFIPYGTYADRSPDESYEGILREYGIQREGYYLQITRLSPDNNPLLTLKAFNRIKTAKKLVIIGSHSYNSAYYQEMVIEAKKNAHILILDGIYDKSRLAAIWKNCFAYIHGNEVGGTNPALLQAIAFGNRVIARDCVFNREVLKKYGFYYLPNIDSLVTQLDKMEKEPLAVNKSDLFRYIEAYYDWDAVTKQYLQSIESLKQ